ncbi:MAG TPA: serine/threonine-protein kinase, partial [Allocoleopsis sp.]
RFNESCVLKEYNPGQVGTYALQKSKELFQREAQVLYQIDHPQIPKFRASFEYDKRLFLVQDYVKGKTYSSMLAEKVQNQSKFSEAEVIKFMQNMLPILEHIHSKGIIHRDISPDNIILRESDNLPVLIDFGVVKQGIDQSGEISRGTTVGKIGYSPNEQLQTGQVFPNSDLYALAVTCVVLMTGRKPQDLFDQSTMVWRWHQWLPALTPWFGNLLNRMLNLRPNNRYQSATEVMQQLRSLAGLIPTGENQQNTAIDDSNNPTVINSNPTNKTASQSTRNNQNYPRPPLKNRSDSGWYNGFWTLVMIRVTLMFLALAIPAILFRIFVPPYKPTIGRVDSQKFPPPVTENPNNTSPPNTITTPVQTNPIPQTSPNTSPNTSPPISQSEQIILQIGQTASRTGNLQTGQIMTYIVPVRGSQKLSVTAIGNATISVLSPTNQLVDIQAQNTPKWEGVVQISGDYSIQVSSSSNQGGSYQINIGLSQ